MSPAEVFFLDAFDKVKGLGKEAKEAIEETAKKIPHPLKTKKPKYDGRLHEFEETGKCPVCGVKYKHIKKFMLDDGKNEIERKARMAIHLIDHTTSAFMG